VEEDFKPSDEVEEEYPLFFRNAGEGSSFVLLPEIDQSPFWDWDEAVTLGWGDWEAFA
jgi:hypothetical protein